MNLMKINSIWSKLIGLAPGLVFIGSNLTPHLNWWNIGADPRMAATSNALVYRLVYP